SARCLSTTPSPSSSRLFPYTTLFRSQRQVLEVDTPFLAHYGVSDIHIQCIHVPGYGFLQSSPEYHMKRMLAHGVESIYQIARVFRDGEQGQRHNPEFTLLEWYRLGIALPELIQECVDLLKPILQLEQVAHYSFRHVFQKHTGLDPMRASVAELEARAQKTTQLPTDLTRGELVDWLMDTAFEPALPHDQITSSPRDKLERRCVVPRARA